MPVLLIGLSSIEATHWYFARQAVSLALTQAARAAITAQANPHVLDHAFSEALLPMYAAPTRDESRLRLQRAMDRRIRATELPAWRIRILSPSEASFKDFGVHAHPELPRHGRAVIDNDYLHEQHLTRLEQGWPEGRGRLSGQTTLEANILALHLTWLHEPLLPGVRNLLRALAPTGGGYHALAMARGGYLPLHREVALVMQSHAVAWETPEHGRVVRAPGVDGTEKTSEAPEGDPVEGVPTSYSTQRCNGLWCLSQYRAGDGEDRVEGEGGDPGGEPGSALGSGSNTGIGTGIGTGPDSGSGPGAASGSGSADRDSVAEAGDTPYRDADGAGAGAEAPPAEGLEPLPEELDDCPGCCV